MIVVGDLTKIYARARADSAKALDRLSFQVPARSVVCFLGPNGAGKTTTIRILATILRPTMGSHLSS